MSGEFQEWTDKRQPLAFYHFSYGHLLNTVAFGERSDKNSFILHINQPRCLSMVEIEFSEDMARCWRRLMYVEYSDPLLPSTSFYHQSDSRRLAPLDFRRTRVCDEHGMNAFTPKCSFLFSEGSSLCLMFK